MMMMMYKQALLYLDLEQVRQNQSVTIHERGRHAGGWARVLFICTEAILTVNLTLIWPFPFT
jgi:hypothetical protein